jgi:hypothetical protein
VASAGQLALLGIDVSKDAVAQYMVKPKPRSSQASVDDVGNVHAPRRTDGRAVQPPEVGKVIAFHVLAASTIGTPQCPVKCFAMTGDGVYSRSSIRRRLIEQRSAIDVAGALDVHGRPSP